MKKSKWDDEQLEELLRQMPKVTDYRDPRDIYQNISSKIKKRKKQNWMMPAFAGAVSLLLFLILTPGFLDLNRSANQEAKDEANNDLISKTSDNHSISTEKMEVIQDMELSNENENMKPTSTEQAITAVYEEDLKKYDKIIYAIPDENIQNIVPVTILVDKDEAKNWFEQFMEMSSSLSEQEWGLSNYYPLNAVIAYEDSTVQVDLPANHNYGQGSAAAETFFKSLNETFSSQEVPIDKIIFSTEGQPGMKGHDAVITELPIKKENNNGYFLFQPINNKKPFLVPYPKSYDNIQNAFEDMEQPIPEYELMQSISENIKIERIVEKDQLLIIYLTKDSQLENDENTVYSFEAILLTAKDFGYDTVKFENAPIEKIGPFNLSEPIKVPLSPNKRFLAENHKK